MQRDVASIRSRLRNDEPAPDLLRLPATFRRDVADEAPASVRRRQNLADINKLGLEFDNQDRAALKMPAHKIDDSALPVAAEGDLGLDDPAPVDQHRGDLLAHRGVTSSHEAIEIPSSPPSDEVDSDLEGCRGSA